MPATELLNELMGLLRQHVLANPLLRKKLFQVRLLGRLLTLHHWR